MDCSVVAHILASLELNIHQLILSEIASNAGDSEEDLHFAGTVIGSKVQTRNVRPGRHHHEPSGSDSTPRNNAEDEDSRNEGETVSDRVFMVRSNSLNNTIV